MLKALIEITEKMQDARACCGEESGCNDKKVSDKFCPNCGQVLVS